MLNRKFSWITASCLSIGVTLASLPQLGLGSKAIAVTNPGNPQIEALDSSTHIAQRGGGRRRGDWGRWMDELNLTDAQRSEVDAIKAKYRPQMEALRSRARNASSDERRAIRDEGRTLRSQIKDEIYRNVLTPEQRERANELREERRQNRQGRRSDRPSQ